MTFVHDFRLTPLFCQGTGNNCGLFCFYCFCYPWPTSLCYIKKNTASPSLAVSHHLVSCEMFYLLLSLSPQLRDIAYYYFFTLL